MGLERKAVLRAASAHTFRYERRAGAAARLSALPSDVRVIGEQAADRARRVATVSFVVAKRGSVSIPPHCDAHGIGIRYGDCYSRDLIDALGLRASNGVVRVSMARYNTLAEVGRLIGVLEQIL